MSSRRLISNLSGRPAVFASPDHHPIIHGPHRFEVPPRSITSGRGGKCAFGQSLRRSKREPMRAVKRAGQKWDAKAQRRFPGINQILHTVTSLPDRINRLKVSSARRQESECRHDRVAVMPSAARPFRGRFQPVPLKLADGAAIVNRNNSIRERRKSGRIEFRHDWSNLGMLPK